MAKLTTLGKPFDEMSSKADKILQSLEPDYTAYYVASLNFMSRPLTLFGKEVKPGNPSEQIKISKEKFYELKRLKYFKKEFDKEDFEGKKIAGLHFIEGELDLLKHKEMESKIQLTTEPIIESVESEIKEIRFTPPITGIVTKKEREPSKYQKEIFKYITMLVNNDPRATQKHVVIEAVAGSGKTFTIEQATKIIPPTKSACFLAFNTHIVDEFRPRASPNIKNNVMTLNSAGYASVSQALELHHKQVRKININNVSNILDVLFKDRHKNFSLEEIDSLKPAVTRAVSLFKATGLEINSTNLDYLTDRYNIDTSNIESSDLIMLTKDVMDINFDIITNTWHGKEEDFIDFDDQIWLPIVKNLPIRKYDFVFVDETQDLNASQLELTIKLCKPGGSIIAVGDRNQSIYGFRGADTEAIPRIISRLDAKVFPLSITYRCPKSHVRLAQELVPEIEYATIENAGYEAIEGEVIKDKTSYDIIDLAIPGDKVICRNNAPLIHPCFQLIREGKKASILGKDIGKGLINLMKKIKGFDLKDFMFRLERWKDKETEKLEKKNQSIDRIMDQYETLQVLSEDCDTIECIILKINKIFSSTEEDIVFSTIHRAKGLETKTIDNSLFIICSYNGKQLMPNPYASKDWEFTQEKNLMYVAYTRAKNKLYLVD